MAGMCIYCRHPGRRRSRRAGIAPVIGRAIPDTACRPFRDDDGWTGKAGRETQP